MSEPVKIGDRVRAILGSGGYWRKGTVTMVMEGTALEQSPQYMVHFDGDTGHSGPCFHCEGVSIA
jgi:hypothetical protein